MECFFKATIQNFEILFLRGGGGGLYQVPITQYKLYHSTQRSWLIG